MMRRTEEPTVRCAHTRRSALVLSILLLLCGSVPLWGAEIASLVPAEALVYMQARDLTQLREAWLKTPWHRMWQDPKFTLFFKPFRESISEKESAFEKDNGLKLEDLRQMFPGQLAVFVSDMRFSGGGAKERLTREVSSGWIGRISSDPERARRLVEETILKDVPASATRSSEKYQGTTIHIMAFRETIKAAIPDRTGKKKKKNAQPSSSEKDSLQLPDASGTIDYRYAYATVGDLLILVEGPGDVIKKVLANYAAAKGGQPGPGALSASAGFKNGVRPLGDGADLLAYVNIERLLKQLRGSPSADFLDKVKPLRLEELKSFALGVRLLPASMQVDWALATQPAPQGIARLLVNGQSNAFATQRMAPRNAVSYSSRVLDISDVWRLAQDTAKQFGPDTSQMVDSFLAQYSQVTQVDIAALLKQMGGEFATFSFPLAGGASDGARRGTAETFLFQLKQPDGFAEKFAKLVPTLMGSMGTGSGVKVATADFAGFRVYTITGGAPSGSGGSLPSELAPKLSFAVARSFLIVSSGDQGVKGALRRIDGEAQDSLAQNEDFRKTTGRFKPGCTALSWTDMRKRVEDLVRTVQSQPLLLMVLGRYVEMTQMPAEEDFGRYFDQLASASYASAEGYRSHLEIRYP